ncbi:MAG: CsbD family protein [Microcoleaceae cyanobacterium]
MSDENRVEATMKNIEGKAQEMMGEITGDPKDQAEGKMKQAQASAQHEVENLKDEAKKQVDSL